MSNLSGWIAPVDKPWRVDWEIPGAYINFSVPDSDKAEIERMGYENMKQWRELVNETLESYESAGFSPASLHQIVFGQKYQLLKAIDTRLREMESASEKSVPD